MARPSDWSEDEAGRRVGGVAGHARPARHRQIDPVLLGGGCQRLICRQEGAPVAHGLLDAVLGVFPRVEAHLGLRREPHGLHGDSVGMPRESSGRTSIGVWQSRTKSRVTVKMKSALERYISLRN